MKLGMEKFLVVSSFVLSALSLIIAIICAINYPDDVTCSVSYDADLTLTDEML